MHVLKVPWPADCLCIIMNDCCAKLAHQPGVVTYAIAVECMMRFSSPASGVRDWQKCPEQKCPLQARIPTKRGVDQSFIS